MMPDSTELAATYLVPARGGTARKVLDDWPPFDTGPDSTIIVRAPRERHRIELASLATGRTIRTIPLPDSITEPQEVAWSRDERWLALRSPAGRVWTLSARGGALKVISDDGRNVRWAPTSDALYFLSGPPGAVDLVRVAIDRRTGERRGDAVPAVVRLREAVQQQDRRPVSGGAGDVPRRPYVDLLVLEALDHPARARGT